MNGGKNLFVEIFYITIGIIILLCIAAEVLNKIAQRHISSNDAMRTYEGSLLVCDYFDENLQPQLVFDTSQLDDKGRMALIAVNPQEEAEAQYFEDAIVGVDDEGVCGVIVLS